MSRDFFNLWRKKHKLFPTTVQLEGVDTSINTDFRVALKLLAIYSDNELSDVRKAQLALRHFYSTIPEQSKIQEALVHLKDFLTPPKQNNMLSEFKKAKKGQDEEENKKPPQICFEFDAEEIYVSFIADYQIDLIEVEYLHWYKFLILFANLSNETPLMKKVELRTKDLSQFKGKEKAKLVKAQKAVQIPEKVSAEEAQAISDFMSKLI